MVIKNRIFVVLFSVLSILSFSVPLLGMETQGIVLVNGVRSVDILARQAKFVEQADSVVVDECLAKIAAIFG